MRRLLFSVCFLVVAPLVHAMTPAPPHVQPPLLPPLPASSAAAAAAASARLTRIAPLRAALRVVRVPVSPVTCPAVGAAWASAAYQMFVDTGSGPRILFPMLTGMTASSLPDPARVGIACAHARSLVIGYFPYAWIRRHMNDSRYSLALFMAIWAQEKAAGGAMGAVPPGVPLDPLGILQQPVHPLPADAGPRTP